MQGSCCRGGCGTSPLCKRAEPIWIPHCPKRSQPADPYMKGEVSDLRAQKPGAHQRHVSGTIGLAAEHRQLPDPETFQALRPLQTSWLMGCCLECQTLLTSKPLMTGSSDKFDSCRRQVLYSPLPILCMPFDVQATWPQEALVEVPPRFGGSSEPWDLAT